MRLLASIDCFEQHRIPPLAPEMDATGKTRYYYWKRRENFQLYPLNPGMKKRALLHCGSVQSVSLCSEAHFRRMDDPALSVEFIHSGELLFRQEDHGYVLEPGDVFLFLPGKIGEFYAANGKCRKTSFVLNGRLLSDCLRASGLLEREYCGHFEESAIALFTREYCSLSTQSGMDAERRNGEVTWRFLDFLTNFNDRGGSEELAELENYCMAHLAEPLTVTKTAAHFGFSESHFIRKCRIRFGETPHQLLVRLRMTEAARLLLLRSYSVKETAELVGYCNALNFSTEFRKYHGVSPRTFLLQHFP